MMKLRSAGGIPLSVAPAPVFSVSDMMIVVWVRLFVGMERSIKADGKS